MPVMSYLAYPVRGKKQNLMDELGALENCEVIPSINKDVLILVTDTKKDEDEKALHAKLDRIESLQCLAMVSAYTDQLDYKEQANES